jgi:hypothetical protein
MASAPHKIDPHAQERAQALFVRDIGGILGFLFGAAAVCCIMAWMNGEFHWDTYTPTPWWISLGVTSLFAIPSIFFLTGALSAWSVLRGLPPKLTSNYN